MRISASMGTGVERQMPRPERAADDAQEQPKAGLPAVIPAYSRPPAADRHPGIRPLAGIVAQLAAHAADHPGTRARRRADPSEGASLYALAAAVTAPIRQNTIRII